MLKLYKNVDDKLHYWETWNKKKEEIGVVHWGVVGDKGEDKEVQSTLLESFKKAIQKEATDKIKEGYEEIDIDDHYTLLIEFTIDGMGSPEDLDKRNQLEDRMNDTLGWTGLGRCDGGSIGRGTMEICCFVVDFDIAKKVIEQDLKGTEFANYTRIYDENA